MAVARNDFEDEGYDEATMQDFRKVSRLSLHTAKLLTRAALDGKGGRKSYSCLPLDQNRRHASRANAGPE
jgi:hypothetical protein